MTAVALFMAGAGLGFFFPWPRTLLVTLLVPVYYLAVYLGLWGSGLGDQWIWAMTFLIVTTFVAICIGIMLGGGAKLLEGRLPYDPRNRRSG